MPKVSVIVPVYNTEKYLPKCLDSLTGQTLSDIEIICINDCSPDNSLAVLQEYAKKDNRIKIIDFKENKGVSIARNTGIDTATGEYIGFIDSDDFIDLDFYEKLYNNAIETGADVVKGNVYNYDTKTSLIELTNFYNINDKIRENPVNFLYGFTSAIYKTNFIKKHKICFPENITHFEDPYFSISVTLYKPKIDFIDDSKYYYVKHSESACANSKTLQQTKSFIKSVRLILDKINGYDISEKEYNVYVLFLIQQVMPWCSDLKLPDDANIEAIKGFVYIIDNLKHSKHIVIREYFMGLKQENKKVLKQNKDTLVQQLRAKIKRNKA